MEKYNRITVAEFYRKLGKEIDKGYANNLIWVGEYFIANEELNSEPHPEDIIDERYEPITECSAIHYSLAQDSNGKESYTEQVNKLRQYLYYIMGEAEKYSIDVVDQIFEMISKLTNDTVDVIIEEIDKLAEIITKKINEIKKSQTVNPFEPFKCYLDYLKEEAENVFEEVREYIDNMTEEHVETIQRHSESVAETLDKMLAFLRDIKYPWLKNMDIQNPNDIPPTYTN